MADLGGLMKQSKELINVAYDKGFNEGNKLGASILKKRLLAMIDKVENEPTGARYWIGTQELKNILERY